MTTTANRPSDFKVVGTRPIRHDGYDKVTGRAKYGADIQLADLLHGSLLRSPHAHARIRSIDTSKAEALEGVRAVITWRDLPEKPTPPTNFMEMLADPQVLTQICLARGKALYKGHAIAAVAATSKQIADAAIDLIQVDFEVLPHVLTVEEAMAADAPVLHATLRTKDATAGGDSGATNIAAHHQLKQGNIEKGFAEADLVVEREFSTKPVHQGYIETHNSTVLWGADGNVTIWTSTQGPFIVRHQVASILNIATSSVKVVPMEIGGGFGGKISCYLDPVAATLSKKTGHPVKIAMSRKEVFEATGPASGTNMRVKIGAKRDGTITAAQVNLVYEAGAFPGSSVASGAGTCLAPYKIDHLLIDGYDVVVNKPKTAAYRAPGSPQAAFAVEQTVDEITQKLGLDPMELRLKNVTRTGDRQANGVSFPSIGAKELEEAIKDHPHYKTPLGDGHKGRGVAMGYWGNAGMASSATLSVTSNGQVSLVTGSVDIGGSRASLAMQAAEVLGLTAEDVHPSVGDTDAVGYTGVTGGSRTTFATGIAVLKAAEDIKDQMIRRAALLWETQPDDIQYTDGAFVSTKNTADRLSFKELAGKLMDTGGPVTASASSDPKQIGPSFAALLVDVDVDRETGKVTVERATVFQDVGKAAHPSYVEGQMQGGTAQGIGWALNEEYYYLDSGVMANSSFLDYRIPTSYDLPMIEPVIIEVPNPGHPFGLRGVGEASLVPPMAAVANAVSQAIGQRVTELPMSPGTLLKALSGDD